MGKGKVHGGQSVKSLRVKKLTRGLSDEVPSKQRPKEVKEHATHMSPEEWCR